MKKKIIVLLLSAILCLCTGCDIRKIVTGEIDFSEDPEKINVIVSGVDDGILHCKYVCEWEDSYAYYDQGVIYYYENDGSEPYEIECAGLEYMDMNDGYIYFTKGTGMMVLDKKSKQTTEISEMGEVLGINIYEDDVIMRCRADNNETAYCEINGTEIVKQTVVEYPDIYVSTNNHCVNKYCFEDSYVYVNKKIYMIHGEGYKFVDKKGNEGELYEFEGTNMGPESSPEHICEYEGKFYILRQFNVMYDGVNIEYRYKDWDQLTYLDIEEGTSKTLYKTSGREEQIVSFSVENDELYLLIEGKLYKSTLTGENKTELTDLSGIAQTLSFDYGNDTLFVYDGEKLIGQYK